MSTDSEKTLEQICQEQGIVVTDKHRDVARRIKRVANGVVAKIEAEFGRPIKSTFIALEEMLAKYLPDNSEELANVKKQRDSLLETLRTITNATIELAPYPPEVSVGMVAIVESARAEIAKAQPETVKVRIAE